MEQQKHEESRQPYLSLPPQEIERRSFAIIAEELKAMGIALPGVHTSADFDYAKTLTYSEGAVGIVKTLLRDGADIVTDTNMALAGINRSVLSSFGGEALCYMADEKVARIAKERNVTRATVSMELAAARGRRTVFAIGNAPTALLSLLAIMEKGAWKPDFVIGVPVGFVNVVYAKERILESGIPCIVNRGRKGGSNIAAAICNALLYELRLEQAEKGDEDA